MSAPHRCAFGATSGALTASPGSITPGSTGRTTPRAWWCPETATASRAVQENQRSPALPGVALDLRRPHGVKVVSRAEIDRPIVPDRHVPEDIGRVGRERPSRRPVGVDGVQVPVAGAEINHAVAV